jgi:hypothetical protein
VCHQGRISGSGGLQYHRNDEVIIMKKYFLYFLGLNLIAFAVVLNVRFDLGVAAFSSVMYSISQIYNISLGTASIICYLIFVIIQCILSKKITVCIFRKNCASVPEERSAIPLQTEQSSAG